jgi:hypothetical protein
MPTRARAITRSSQLRDPTVEAPERLAATERSGMSNVKTRYAKSGDVHIAYQVVGEGSADLVVVQGWATNLELWWEDPGWSAFYERWRRSRG